MNNNDYKKYSDTWKQFLNESKSSSISEAGFGPAAKSAATAVKKFGSSVSQAFGGKKAPTGNGISSYSINSRKRAGELMAKGTTIPTTIQDKEAVTATTDLEQKLDTHTFNAGGLATLDLKSSMFMIADGERCELATANWKDSGEATLWVSAPVWSLGTGDMLRDYDNITRFFFDKDEEYQKFLQLLKEAMADIKGTKGIIGECSVRMIDAAHDELLERSLKIVQQREDDPKDTTRVKQLEKNIYLVANHKLFPTRERLIVGTMNIIWNNNFFPAVVISFGMPENKGLYSEYPFFLTPAGTQEFLKTMKSTEKKDGSVYRPMLGTDLAYPSIPYVFSTVCKGITGPAPKPTASAATRPLSPAADSKTNLLPPGMQF